MKSIPLGELHPGTYLVAEPFLKDPHFFRSVVILVEHNENGTIGFVVNKKIDLPLSELIDVPEGIDLDVFLGGPVQQDTIFYLHTLGDSILPKSIAVSEHLWWSSDFSGLFELMKKGAAEEKDVKVLLGYSGWSVGQLREECENESWVTAQADAKFIFDHDTEHIWKKVLSGLGGIFTEMTRYPIDPNLN